MTQPYAHVRVEPAAPAATGEQHSTLPLTFPFPSGPAADVTGPTRPGHMDWCIFAGKKTGLYLRIRRLRKPEDTENQRIPNTRGYQIPEDTDYINSPEDTERKL